MTVPIWKHRMPLVKGGGAVERLKEYRKGCNMTTVELAAKMGTTRGTITRWEKGQRSPDVETLKALACVFDCTIDDLVGARNANPPSAPEEAPGKKRVPKTVKRDRRRVG